MRSLALWLAMSAAVLGQTIDPSTVELTAQGSGYYRVYVDDEEVSKHTTEREAAERAVRELAGNPGASVRFTHDYSVIVTASVVQPTPTPDPDPVPDPDPAPDPDPTPDGFLSVADFELIGGWKLKEEFARGGLTIDFDGRRLWSCARTTNDAINEYAIPALGTGTDIAAWPTLSPIRTHSKFWGRGTARDVEFRDGTLWVSARQMYDTVPEKLTIFGKNLATGEIVSNPTNLLQPAFGGGFIEGHPTEFLLGNGGYESGQGSVAGPTVAKADGTVLLGQANHGTLSFSARTPRPANYTVKAAGDTWWALHPRDADGDGNLDGAWASDDIRGGGLWTPKGVLFWVTLGVGELDYALQSECFAQRGSTEAWLYVYDPETYQLIGYERWPHGKVHGCEIGPDGTIYTLVRDAWKVGQYQTGSVVRAFRVNR